MKKFIFVLLVLTLCLGMHCNAAESATITAQVTVEGDNVIVTGTTGAGAGKEVTIYVKNPTGGLSYINQTTSDSKGDFEFAFPLTYNVTDGEYTVYIGGTNIAPPGVHVFSYSLSGSGGNEEDSVIPSEPEDTTDPNESKIETFSNIKFIDADITVSLSGYVPKLTGTISCTSGKSVNINAINTTDNTVIIDETVTYDKGVHSLSYSLPSLISSKDYKIIVTVYDKNVKQAEMTVFLDTSIVLVSIDGSTAINNNLRFDAQLETVNTDLVNKSATISGHTNISVTLPNLVSNASFHLALKGYESYTEDTVTEIRNGQNQNLYNALKKARPNLDSDSDGIITKKELSGITGTLDLSNADLSNIAGLGQCTSVSGIIVSHNKIKSLRPLSGLTNLEYVDAHDNRITNISTMPENLRYFNIDSNNVKGLQGLKNADKLEFLSVADNPISALNGIGDKVHLRYINLRNSAVSDVSLLRRCTRLTYLNLGSSAVTDFSPLEDLEHLYYLYK